jgi:hypothetical protein
MTSQQQGINEHAQRPTRHMVMPSTIYKTQPAAYAPGPGYVITAVLIMSSQFEHLMT